MKVQKRLLLRLTGRFVARYYFRREDYAEAVSAYLDRLGWGGAVKEGIAQLCFLLGTTTCYIPPQIVRFEVASVCNLRCPMCPQPTKMNRPRMLMDFNLYKRVLDANPQIREVDLFNWGEPLLHPMIDDFVSYATNKNILTRLVTNAVLLNENMTKRLVEAGLKEVYFSIDNIGESYEKIRGFSFDKIVDNIAYFLQIAKNRTSVTKIGANIVESPYNLSGTEKAIQEILGLGINSISIEQYQPYDSQLKRTFRCFEPYRYMVVLSNGQVVPCCVDYDGTLAIGSVHDELDLKKLFNNQAFQQIRVALKSPKTMPQICSSCNYRMVSPHGI